MSNQKSALDLAKEIAELARQGGKPTEPLGMTTTQSNKVKPSFRHIEEIARDIVYTLKPVIHDDFGRQVVGQFGVSSDPRTGAILECGHLVFGRYPVGARVCCQYCIMGKPKHWTMPEITG
jgi:hypothetical protein